jgi:hypothetical protein
LPHRGQLSVGRPASRTWPQFEQLGMKRPAKDSRPPRTRNREVACRELHFRAIWWSGCRGWRPRPMRVQLRTRAVLPCRP